MKKIYSLIIATFIISSNAYAQSPAQNLMPDGSHDMYLGLGVVSRPLYEGANQTKRQAVPVMQMQWSNGVFVAGMSAGWHLSQTFDQEFGPIITMEPSRTANGTSGSIQMSGDIHSGIVDPNRVGLPHVQQNRLIGMDDIRTRLLFGGFYNYQLSGQLRQTNTLMFGAGNDQRGIRLSSDLRYHLRDALPHHQFTFGTGFTLVNRAYANSYFGVSELEADRSINLKFSTKAGIKDVHADVFWNWNLNSSWMVTSKLNVSRLVGDNRNSPLVERNTNVAISSAIAYRF
ncbi:MipA/OmpV family protein [Undibacterium flavidum]|uniref:MipA/OmpV family protein n=1 Tax=Undibacterium flavidum TaxID=2762297 RepID=A0ABR6YGE7_9BURK|nr:MipA/OmpV family protein [Undibacterium flavidum]MBC3875607.1 MipA/OmpV family protein [Undibacterium flavidum]